MGKTIRRKSKRDKKRLKQLNRDRKQKKNERERCLALQFPRIGCELGLADPLDVEPEIMERFYHLGQGWKNSPIWTKYGGVLGGGNAYFEVKSVAFGWV